MNVSRCEEVLERRRAVVQIRVHPAPGYTEHRKGVGLWFECRVFTQIPYAFGNMRGRAHESQNVSESISLKTDLWDAGERG
jgi:hypothetical protein